MTTTQVSWGPEMTPKLIRTLIFATCGASIALALLEPLIPALTFLFSLSWHGWKQGFVWQLASYLFVEETYGAGPSMFFLLSLAFNMYLLWIMGSDLLARVGRASFLRFYLISGVLAGVAALWAMSLTQTDRVLSGPTSAIIALVTAWTLFNPNVTLLFFFLVHIKAKWLWVFLIALVILIPLSHLDWVLVAFYGAALLIGYMYSVMAWELEGPFAWLRIIDRPLKAIGRSFKRLGKWRLKRGQKGKIIDFKTGETVLDDNAFVDAMLEKISKHGQASLSWKERQRLDEIAKKKKSSSK